MPDSPVRITAAQPHVTKRSLWLWAYDKTPKPVRVLQLLAKIEQLLTKGVVAK